MILPSSGANSSNVMICVLPDFWHVGAVTLPPLGLAHTVDNEGPERSFEHKLGFVRNEPRRAVDLRLNTCLGGQLLPVPARCAQCARMRK